jgi:hypothetical protein
MYFISVDVSGEIIIYYLKTIIYYHEKVFDCCIKIPMENNSTYFHINNHSDFLSNGNN